MKMKKIQADVRCSACCTVAFPWGCGEYNQSTLESPVSCLHRRFKCYNSSAGRAREVHYVPSIYRRLTWWKGATGPHVYLFSVSESLDAYPRIGRRPLKQMNSLLRCAVFLFHDLPSMFHFILRVASFPSMMSRSSIPIATNSLNASAPTRTSIASFEPCGQSFRSSYADLQPEQAHCQLLAVGPWRRPLCATDANLCSSMRQHFMATITSTNRE